MKWASGEAYVQRGHQSADMMMMSLRWADWHFYRIALPICCHQSNRVYIGKVYNNQTIAFSIAWSELYIPCYQYFVITKYIGITRVMTYVVFTNLDLVCGSYCLMFIDIVTYYLADKIFKVVLNKLLIILWKIPRKTHITAYIKGLTK